MIGDPRAERGVAGVTGNGRPGSVLAQLLGGVVPTLGGRGRVPGTVGPPPEAVAGDTAAVALVDRAGKKDPATLRLKQLCRQRYQVSGGKYLISVRDQSANPACAGMREETRRLAGARQQIVAEKAALLGGISSSSGQAGAVRHRQHCSPPP